MKKMETFDVLDVHNNVVSKVARTVAVAKKIGIKIGWVSRVIGNICANRTILPCCKRTDYSLLDLRSFRRRWTRWGETCRTSYKDVLQKIFLSR